MWPSFIEIWFLQPPTLQKELTFWVFSEELLHDLIYERSHRYEVTLVKRDNNPLLQKSEAKISDQKRFHKNLVEGQGEKKRLAF